MPVHDLRGRRALWRSFAPVAVVAALMLVPWPAQAANNELSGGSVSPEQGTTETVFHFTVRYESDQLLPPEVRARVGEVIVPMRPAVGTVISGTYEGSSSLPEGEWRVVFESETTQGNPDRLEGPMVVVRSADPTARPTAAPTQAPTAPPATPDPTSTATPRPTAVPAAATATVTATPTASPPSAETPGGQAFTAEPSGSSPSGSGSPGAVIAPAGIGGESVPLDIVGFLFMGGTMAGAGAAYLGVLLIQRRLARSSRRESGQRQPSRAAPGA